MNILLWVLQIVLVPLCLAGGGYKVFAFQVVPMGVLGVVVAWGRYTQWPLSG